MSLTHELRPRAPSVGPPHAHGTLPHSHPRAVARATGAGPLEELAAATRPLLGERPERLWRHGSLVVDRLPASDLGNSSFIVADRDRRSAVVIDPTRDIRRYEQHLRRLGADLDWALDTHLHADFVSGGSQLAQRLGAKFGISADARARIPHHPLRDQQSFGLGSDRLTVLRSPGHTPEHVSFLLRDERGRPRVLFSGGSLMAGSAGRPDLLGPRYTSGLVRAEYETLHSRYASLPGSVVVMPTHGGGSFCGVGTGEGPTTTIAAERDGNRLWRARSFEEFDAAYRTSLPFPAYYRFMRAINRAGGTPLEDREDLPALAPERLEALRTSGVTVLDVRPWREFERAHVPGSVSIPSYGPFSAWVGWLWPKEEPFVLVGGDARDRERVHTGLLRIGYDGLVGYLDTGVEGYASAGFETLGTPSVTMRSVRLAVDRGTPLTLLDVRNPHEARERSVPVAVPVPLPTLGPTTLRVVPKELPVFVHCETGYRAGIAAGLLERYGFPDVRHVMNGPDAWGPTGP